MGETFQKYKICEDITWRETNDEIVVLNLQTSEYYSTNNVASVIWEFIAKNTPQNDLVDFLTQEYEITPKTAQKDINDFLKNLLKLKLIQKI
jgi:Coenzyme PQQ synthesis protein D (PqqD)